MPGQPWMATVTVLVHDENHSPVANLTVSGAWSAGSTVFANGVCTTDATGKCSLVQSALARKRQTSVTFTVSNITGAASYDAAANHDPDGDSSGTSITVAAP